MVLRDEVVCVAPLKMVATSALLLQGASSYHQRTTHTLQVSVLWKAVIAHIQLLFLLILVLSPMLI